MKLSIIIPVYNEAATFEELIERVYKVDLGDVGKEIIIVESNSTDGTKEIVKKYESRENTRVIYEKKPRGKGSAVKLGLKYVTGDIVIIQDADLEYEPEEYSKLIQPIIDRRSKIVYGSRCLDENYNYKWKIRKGFENKAYEFLLNIGGVIYTKMFNFVYKTKLTDGATMSKVFAADVIKAIDLKSDGFGYDWEMTAKARRMGHSFLEVPIKYYPRGKEGGKKVKFFRDGFKVLYAILRYRI